MALRSVSRHKNKVEVQSVFKFLCLEPPGNSKNEAYGKRFFSLLHLNEMLIHCKPPQLKFLSDFPNF